MINTKAKEGKYGLTYPHTQAYDIADIKSALLITKLSELGQSPDGVDVLAVRHGVYASMQVKSEIPNRYYIWLVDERDYTNYRRKEQISCSHG